jgi:DOPA 4,5-dioxygenase
MVIHPDTGRPRSDHLVHAMWLGEILAINAERLPDQAEPEPAIVPNTNPTVAP